MGTVPSLGRCLLQADEIWCYIGAKDKKLRPHHPKEFGSQFVFVAIDSETKLCRPHITLEGCTPAMEAGVTDHVWSIEELLEAA